MPDPAGTDPRSPFGMWLLLLAVLGLFLGTTLWASVQVQGEAPAFSLVSTGYEDGRDGDPVPFTLADYRGKTVVLDFMAVTCDACAQVTDDVLRPLWAAHGNDTRFALLSIDTWADPATAPGAAQGPNPPTPWKGAETRENLVELQKRTGVPWRHALDTDQVWLKYSAVSLPELVVVSPDGRIVYSREATAGPPSYPAVASAVEASMAGVAPSVSFAQMPIAGVAFVAGMASVLTPCTAGMLPAYLGMLLQQAQAAPLATRVRRSLLGGLAAAAGILVVYLALALLFYLFEATLRPALGYAAPFVGVTLVLAGIVAMAGRGLPGFGRLARGVDGRRGFFLFGLAFALAGFGCTGPIFVPILWTGFLDGPATGMLLFATYAAAVAIVVVVAAALVGEGAVTRARKVLDWTPGLQRVAGALMAAAGLYVLWYYRGA